MRRAVTDRHVDGVIGAIEPVTASTLAERGMVASWLRTAAGNRDAILQAVRDAQRDAAEHLGTAATVAEIHAWVEAGLTAPHTARSGVAHVEWRRTPSQARRWVVETEPGATLVYHVGRLASDRAHNPVLSALADYVSALDHLGAVRAITAKTALPSCGLYLAQRRKGFRHHPLVLGILTPIEYRALVALRDKEPFIAAGKTLERRVPCNADTAAKLLVALARQRLIARQEGVKGHGAIEVTERGLAVLKEG